jgi:predicted amidophosphoribosyltransferase
MKMWKRIDKVELDRLPHLTEQDACHYARDYFPRSGYQHSRPESANQLIINFKKPENRKKYDAEWKHRESAVAQFANELCIFLQTPKIKGLICINQIALMYIPGSKSKQDPLYSTRFDDVLKILKEKISTLQIVEPIAILNSGEASHETSNSELRDPEKIKGNYTWRGLEKKHPMYLMIIDDVLTTGSHFKAVRLFLQENEFKGRIFGFFWAKSKWDDLTPVSDEELEKFRSEF